MLKVSILSTGSIGNSTILDNGTDVILLDIGIKNKKDWVARAKDRGYSFKDINALFITHAHGDHVTAAPLNAFIAEVGNEKIYVTPGVANDISRKQITNKFKLSDINTINVNDRIKVGTFIVKPIRMEHYGFGKSRVTECVGFDIFDEVNGKRYLYASDTKTLDHVDVPREGFDLLMVEDNYCEIWARQQFEIGAAMDVQYMRTKDHMSSQKLAKWLFENNIKDAPVIRLHESPRNKRPGTMLVTAQELNQEFNWD